jgi:pyruvate dehydrogenase E2 component (dihydrolipoamide acetyltransferase)
LHSSQQEANLPKDVIMPALGLAQDTGKIVLWLKADGDFVNQGEPVAEIETDKATLELEAEASGYLKNICAEAGADVPVGEVIAKIWTEDEIKHEEIKHREAPFSGSGSQSRSATTQEGKESRTSDQTIGAAISPAPDGFKGVESAPRNLTDHGDSRLPSSPKARRLAAEQGIDLNTLSAVAGRPVVASDLHQSESGNVSSGESPAMTRTWRIMAERMTDAWTSIPHFYLSREVDASRIVALKQSSRISAESKVTISDLLVHAVAKCLRDHPRLHSLWQDGGPYATAEINIGLAVASDEGLAVPVIHRADSMSLEEIARTRTEIVRRAQFGKPRPDDLVGGTFTISNLGMYGVDSFHAIVNPPQAAILAVGRIAERVVAAAGNFSVKPFMTMTLSCDHRLVDGVRAARFLNDLANTLEGQSESSI